MELFARFRRAERDVEPAELPPVPRAALPHVNQRVTVWVEGHSPVPSRVEDDQGENLVIASPNLALEAGDPVSVSWEGERGWYTLETHVTDLDESGLPTIGVSFRGKFRKHHNRRSDLRIAVSLPLDLRVVVARVVKGGRSLNTRTVEVGSEALQFATSAPFAPGDVLEGRLALHEGDTVSVRLKVIRVDSVRGSWRQTCTASFEDILRSDQARITAFLETQQRVGSVALEDIQPHE